MAVSVVTKHVLVLNPAFLQELKDGNPGLWDTQHQIRQVCDVADRVDPSSTLRELVPLLDNFRDQLATQFSLEESFGFLEVSAKGAPASVDRSLVAKAQSQHCPMCLQITDLAEQAEELQYRGVVPQQLDQLVQSVKSFDAQLREHENFEAELIEYSLEQNERL